MTGTHVTREQLDRLRDGQLPPAALAEVGGHVATCEACGKAVGEVLSVARMTRDLRIQVEADHESEHLTDDELMAHADGTLRRNAHLQECELCRAELDELMRFKSGSQPRRNWVPFAIAASLAVFVLVITTRDRAPATAPVAVTRPTVVPVPTPPAAVSTGYGRPEWDSWVADARKSRALPMPAIIAELQPQQSQLRGATEADDLQLSPDGAVVVSTRPQLQWDKREGASFIVILRNDDEIVESDPLTDPQWTPPQDLKRGAEYLWQVEMTIDGARSIYPKTPAPPARFRVVEQSALDEIENARKQHPEDFLLRAVILARHGLRNEALTALDQLKRSDAALAADLRKSLLDWS